MKNKIRKIATVCMVVSANVGIAMGILKLIIPFIIAIFITFLLLMHIATMGR